MSLTLHGFASTLLSDPHALAAYELDPQGALAKAGLEDITPQDVQEILPLVTEYGVTEYGQSGAFGAGTDGGFALGGLHTPDGMYQANGSLDLTDGGDPAGYVGLTTPDGSNTGLRADEDGAGARGQLYTEDGRYEAGGSLDLADGPGGDVWVSTPDGSFIVGASPDGLAVGGDAAFSRFADLGDSLDSDTLDLAGGASSVASLLTSGADLGDTAMLGGGIGGLDDSLGDTGVPMDVLPMDSVPMDSLPLTVPELPAQLPVDVPQVGGADVLQLPVQLPQLPVELPQLPVELPALDRPLETVDATVDSLPSSGLTDGLTDGVSGTPAGGLLTEAGDATHGLFGLDEHLPL